MQERLSEYIFGILKKQGMKGAKNDRGNCKN